LSERGLLEKHLGIVPVALAFAGGVALGECWRNIVLFLLCSLLLIAGAAVLIDRAPKISTAAVLVALFFVGAARGGLGGFALPKNHGRAFEYARTHFAAQLSVIKDERAKNFIARIVAGEKKSSSELEARFYKSGTGHVLAISGLHLGIVAYIAGVFLKRVVVNLKLRAIGLIVFCGSCCQGFYYGCALPACSTPWEKRWNWDKYCCCKYCDAWSESLAYKGCRISAFLRCYCGNMPCA